MARRYLRIPDAVSSRPRPSFQKPGNNLLSPAIKPAVSRHNGCMRGLGALLMLVVLWQWGSAGWIMAKAQVAQWLIARAWEEMLAQDSAGVKPWPWADTYPVARLGVESRNIDLYVLEGAQGNSLAFAPGHLQGTALPGDGVSVIGGHRDTHFHFLKDLAPGDDLQLQIPSGRRLYYRIEKIEVVDSRYKPLILDEGDEPALISGLVLITCYPFNGIDPAGPLRLVVRARELGRDYYASIKKRELIPPVADEQVISSFGGISQPERLFRL